MRLGSIPADLSRFLDFIRLPLYQYRFGYVAGHSHISDEQVASIKDILRNAGQSEKENIVGSYEKKFAALVGPGRGLSFAAARMGFYILMDELGIGKGDEIILPAFTCGVMANAILRREATPVFTNISEATFGSDPAEIEKKITDRTKMVVAQHTFGIPCDIAPIASTCREKGIFLLEDSAIALDSSVGNKKVGRWGDAAIFSTEHNKPLNTIIGGFFYSENRDLLEKIRVRSNGIPDLEPIHQENLFRRFLFERKYYTPARYGKGLFLGSIQQRYNSLFAKGRMAVFLDRDYCRPGKNKGHGYPYPARMPAALAKLGIYELERWDTVKERRKGILKKYLAASEDLPVRAFLPAGYFDKSYDIIPLRFLFAHPEADRINHAMKGYVHINTRLYTEPISCDDNKLDELGYHAGSCTVSEKACSRIINWPCTVPPEMEETIVTIFRDTFSATP